MHSLSSQLLVLFILSLLQGCSAQDCDATNCETSFESLGPPNGDTCYVDPSDPADLAAVIAVCPCAANKPVDGNLIYTGLDGIVSTATPVAPGTLVSQYFYGTITEEYNVALTAILPGSPVTLSVSVGIPAEAAGFYIYTQLQSQSIFYTAITSTITSTITSQTTTTQTATEIDISILPASTSTTLCTTGIETFTAKTVTTTSTVTSTPVPRTIHKTIISTTTTTLSCLPGPTAKAKARRSPHKDAWEKRAVVAQYEVPRCDYTPASTIEIVTSTTVSTAIATTVDTSTAYTTTTQVTTSQLPPVTVCSNVEGSTTFTPTKTKTKTVHLSRSTTTTTNSVTITKTVVPKHLGVCSTPGAAIAAANHRVQAPLNS